ncbi:Eukaryotic translation initiation factor 3 110 kDa subunit [Actinacidiphila cocklensis]|uniref:Eukaryotic translation initiation factor 3 110 kDa subunit n=1 Tax=Actinacidiphila cocklensis TaxID=887465 RepID=A0A9W4DXR0_9ACTN|nr:Eukaryotic translation initiation factor 3 110 kDa subunit [Actinacidiphila cocklensis]
MTPAPAPTSRTPHDPQGRNGPLPGDDSWPAHRGRNHRTRPYGARPSRRADEPTLRQATARHGRQSTSRETFEGLQEVYIDGNGVRVHVLEVDITDINVLS